MTDKATCTITNDTASPIVITAIEQVNNDQTFEAPVLGTKINTGQSFTIRMGNHAIIVEPIAVGFALTFLSESTDAMGGITFKDPEVTPSSFSYENESVFSYNETNPSANNYAVKIGLA